MSITQILLISLLCGLHKTNGQDNEGCLRSRCRDGRCPRRSFDRCPEEPCTGRGVRRCEGSLACLPINRTCPGKPCSRGEIKCADGTCLPRRWRCEDGSIGCRYPYMRRCTVSLCVKLLQYCPGDPCPDDAPFRCGNDCGVSCDGTKQCFSGEDELNCNATTTPHSSLERFKSPVWVIIITTVLPFFFSIFVMVLILICPPKRNRASAKKPIRDNDDDLMVQDYQLPSLAERRHQVINQMQQENIWTTFHDHSSTTDRIRYQERSIWNRSRGIFNHSTITSLNRMENAPVRESNLSLGDDELPSDLPVESPSEVPYILPSNLPPYSPSLSRPPSYQEVMRKPSLYPTVQPPMPAHLIQSSVTPSGKKNRPMVLPFTPLNYG